MPLAASPKPDRLADRLRSPDYRHWRSQVEATGGCAQPIHLTGLWRLRDKNTGACLASHRGRILVPCGNRRESICPACSDRYAADAFHLMRAGLSGGTKGVPTSVTDQPRMFLTLTAPSFGTVHNSRTSDRGKVMPCPCGGFHNPADQRIGQPIHPDSYDYTGHVLWQAHAGQLWHRFIHITLPRQLAKLAGIRVREIGQHVRLAYAKVAEYQRRGIIHFHAVLRLDGPAGPGDPPPTWATPELLHQAVHAAHAATRVTTPEIDGHARELTWGQQLDLRPIRPAAASQVENTRGEITDDRLASYVAKYATKGTGKSEAADRPIRCQADIDRLQVTEHHRRIIQTAWDLAAPVPCPDCHPDGFHRATGCGCQQRQHIRYCDTCGNGGEVTRTTRRYRLHPELGDKPDPLDALNLRRWAHMLAFRGHFLTKSQRYSTTFKQIRGDRRQYRHEAILDQLGLTDDSITVINHWQMVTVGHHTPEETELALAIAEGRREARKRKYQHERKD